MGMLGMLGIAAAGAAAGLVAAFAGFLDFDAQKVKDKVLILTSIADAVDAGDTAETVATLTSLGVGLAAFGVGSIATGIGQTFMKDDWAVRIKNSVATLVGIGDLDFGKALNNLKFRYDRFRSCRIWITFWCWRTWSSTCGFF